MKRWGFLTGAALGAIAVWAFYAFTTVSDDDLLTSVFEDHCLPFVQTGAAPFADIGRPPGVYDAADLRETIVDGSARIIFEGRFVAQWGTVEGADRESRICEIRPQNGSAVPPAFKVNPTGFVDRYSDVLGLAPDRDVFDGGPAVFGWYEDPSDQSRGLRAVVVGSPGAISSVMILDDLDG